MGRGGCWPRSAHAARRAQPLVERLSVAGIGAHLGSGGSLVDVREPPAFADAHARGSLNIALSNRSAPYWLHTLVGAGERIAIITATPGEVDSVTQLLVAAQRDAVGFAAFDAEDLRAEGIAIGSFRLMTPDELAEELHALSVIDVREASEYAAGHVPGAMLIPLQELRARLDEIPAGLVATICASGFRSSIAASILEAAGRTDLANVWGGTTAWSQFGFAVHHGMRR